MKARRGSFGVFVERPSHSSPQARSAHSTTRCFALLYVHNATRYMLMPLGIGFVLLDGRNGQDNASRRGAHFRRSSRALASRVAPERSSMYYTLRYVPLYLSMTNPITSPEGKSALASFPNSDPPPHPCVSSICRHRLQSCETTRPSL